MNEKLYDIALGVLKDYPALESWTFNNKELEKFVEIIVNECVLISRTSADGFSAGRRMEEHFGLC